MVILENLLTVEQAKELDKFRGQGQIKYHLNTHPIIEYIFKEIEPYSQYPFKKNSINTYFEVQHREKGHKYHYDTGSNQHMTWCGFSASSLLSNPVEFSGGLVKFDDREITPEEHYLSVLAYRSNENEGINGHSVDKHDGVRVVLLMFIECEE